ncbi:nucleoside hydrolase [Dinghuibacter silviterrae]|uniref:Inosine-uridine preferring nucleoside hydrolase n=1 Tax=Dinghuibacter silviterrae TaxID=1539049 RepID=A0A4R8DIK5_9BACT|nr:nucleoside hydrolase [Dinghuibacter silviterrae]TDW97338.1 inosine-uridine preferring nucleoside hydrolase [Dinghuibacter silviterrae]
MKILLLFVCLGAGLTLQAQKRVIFDSDMGPDYDDVGAITMLHVYADSGLIRVLATVASTRYPGVGGVLSVFNTYFHRPSIPIGVAPLGGLMLRDWQHWTDTLLARYPHSNFDDDAVSVYRRVLALAPDSSVTIITVGFLTNLSHLLSSAPDSLSPLPGLALVRRKVRLLVSMAGRFPSGYEFNVMKDAPASAFVFSHWPTPIIFSGFEIGERVLCGLPLIHSSTIQHSPVKDVFRISIPLAPEDSAGRKSWDETAVLVAVKGVAPFYHLEYGHISIAPDGKDTWTPGPNAEAGPGTQARLVEARPPSEVQALIDRLIMR